MDVHDCGWAMHVVPWLRMSAFWLGTEHMLCRCGSMPCRGPGEFRRFLDIALGSRTEVRYLLRLAGDLGYPAEEERGTIMDEAEETGRLLWGLYRSMKAKA